MSPVSDAGVIRKRWRRVRTHLFSKLVFLNLFKQIAKNKSKLFALPSSSASSSEQFDLIPVKYLPLSSEESVAIDVNLDPSRLSSLVKEKSIDQLDQLGGIKGVAACLRSDVNHGIRGDASDILSRKVDFGTNTYPKPPKKSFFDFVWEAVKGVTVLILKTCAAFSVGFGIERHGLREGLYDGGGLLLVVLLVIFVSAICNFRQNRQFEVSNNIQVDVVRNGKRQRISKFEIVVGDIVCLSIGDQVPADGLFLSGYSLLVCESSMTGESGVVEVNCNQNPFLLSGTKVADGFAKMIVTSVGMNTAWAAAMSMVTQDSSEETPLQSRLNKLTSAIGRVGVAVAFLVLVVLLVRYITGNMRDESGNREYSGSVIDAMVRIIAIAVTIVAVAVPDCLPLAVTLTLAFAMKRLLADKAMVRKLSACEIMGSASTLCIDKTGTLTSNQMKVIKFWQGEEAVEGRSYTSISANVIELLHQGVGLNTTGSVYKSTDSVSTFEFSGSSTEKALLQWGVVELEMDMEQVEQNHTILHVEAFNSVKKRSGVLVKKIQDNTVHAHCKGAAEMILAMCTHYYDQAGNLRALDNRKRKIFDQIIQDMAASSLRCIAFAHKQVQDSEHDIEETDKKIPGQGLALLGLVGLQDPCRPGVKEALKSCQGAGVSIKMFTGDNVFTAKAIATKCGILQDGEEIDGAVVEGVEFRNYTEEERVEKVDRIRVMARSSPLDKHLLVQCLKKKGHVVAVTGDGTNDAPALKEADIGLAMGIQGTEVARESSDILILDDNFTSIARVLRWGRCVYINIQKFIQFQLTVNVAALVINFVAAMTAGEVPLTAVQLLWVNLIIDTLGALALATEKPTKDLMEKPPVGKTEPLITNIMWRNLLAQALYQTTILLTLQFKGESIFGISKKVNGTLIFNTFVLLQIFNVFNARELEKKNVFEGIHKNKLFMGIITVTLILQVVMVEFLKRFVDTERLNWEQWGACIAMAAASLPIGCLIKCIPFSRIMMPLPWGMRLTRKHACHLPEHLNQLEQI